MKLSLASLLLAASSGLAASAQCDDNAMHTVWLAGDSTMAPGGGGNGTEGWGQYLRYSLDPARIRVNNLAHAGRSARTFTREGRFQQIIDQVKPGDWVVMEFGHNDGPGDPVKDTVKNRVDCPGIGNETCKVTFNNAPEIVQTYTTYLRNASSIFLSRGARVVISSSTAKNPYQTGKFSWTPTIYSWYSWYVVQSLGGPAAGIYYVPHGNYCAQALKLQGPETAVRGFPMDNTHTAPVLADTYSQAFVLGLKCGTSPLQQYVVNATSRIEGAALGTCLPVNATLPI